MSKQLLLLGLMALVGTYARYFADLFAGKHFNTHIPLATLFVNLTGSFLIGVFHNSPSIPPEWRLAIMTGFLGAFTTFSALSLQGFQLLKAPFPILSYLYLMGSPLLGLLCCALGTKLNST